MYRTWNKLPLISFLRHLLFLLYFLKLFCNIIALNDFFGLAILYRGKRLIPMNIEASVYYSIQIAMDLCINLGYSLHIVAMPMSIVGFCSTIWLNTHPELNFSLGVLFICWAHVEMGLFLNFIVQNRSFGILIDQFYNKHFHNVNSFDLMFNDYDIEFFYEIFGLKFFFDGWNPFNTGSYMDHLYIDYIQTMFRCCGWSGRQFWRVAIPNSCCSYKFRTNCTVMKAFHKPCAQNYVHLEKMLVRLTAEYLIFYLLSMWIGATCLYLERIRQKHLQEVQYKKSLEKRKLNCLASLR